MQNRSPSTAGMLDRGPLLSVTCLVAMRCCRQEGTSRQAAGWPTIPTYGHTCASGHPAINASQKGLQVPQL